jgi:hypothetical protein
MLTRTPPFSFWSVWMYFSTWERLFFVVLGILTIYAIFAAIVTVSRIRNVKAAIDAGNSVDVESTFVVLRRRSARVQRLIGTAFYLFGIVLFLSLQWAHIIIDNSKTPIGWEILENFEVHFIFAFNSFYVFLILHVIGWFIATWVERFGVKLNPRHLS